MKKNIYFLVTHPIQYFVPVYKKLNEDENFSTTVFYCSDETVNGSKDIQFGTEVKWDIPMLSGYNYIFLKNYSWKPSINNGFWGLINFGLFRQLASLPKGIIIIHGWNNFTYLSSIIIAKLMGFKTALRCDIPFKHEKFKKMKFLRKIIFKYLLFPLFDTFLYIGEQNKLFYLYYGVKNEKLFSSPFSVENERFRRDYNSLLGEAKNFRAELGIKANEKVILYSGKYIPKKRPVDLLMATKEIENIKVIFIGDGELREIMEEFAVKNKMSEKVILTGFINQTKISKYYSIADVFIMCSEEGETWGLSTNEAMNFNLPIILYDSVGCSDDLVNHGINGFVVKKGDIDDLKVKIEYTLENEKFRIEAGVESSKIINNYSIENFVKSLSLI